MASPTYPMFPSICGNSDSITPISSHATLNHKIPTNAHQLLHFNWAVYSFGGGHFVSTVSSRNLPFQITLACDQYECGCALFPEFTTCPDILSSGNNLLHHIRASGDTSQIHGYLIHSLRFRDNDTTSSFWKLQSSIFAQLCSLRNLPMVVAVVLPDHNRTSVRSFSRILKSMGWPLSRFDDVYFPSNGDCIAGSCNLLFGVHSSCTARVEPFELRLPPPIQPKPVALICGNHSIDLSILSLLHAIMMTFAGRMFRSRRPTHPAMHPVLVAYQISYPWS